MKQKTEIEIEVKETIAYFRRSERHEAFCPECESVVEMSTPQVAAILTEFTEREIFRFIETGKVHFVETERVLVCLNSLTAIPTATLVIDGEQLSKPVQLREKN